MYSSEKSRASKSANGAIVSTADTYTGNASPHRAALCVKSMREVTTHFDVHASSSLSSTSLAKRRPDGDASQLRNDG